MTPQEYSERDQAHLKREGELDQPRQVRMRSGEIYIAIAVVLVLTAVLLPVLNIYLSNARRAVAQSNAHNLYIAIKTTLLLDNHTPEELTVFVERSEEWRPVEQLLATTDPVEQKLLGWLTNSAYEMDRLQEKDPDPADAALPLSGYWRLEWQSPTVYTVWLAETADGKDAVCFPIRISDSE